jgi:predicted DCC family thiol-disulfide oxidoreductase YuxK
MDEKIQTTMPTAPQFPISVFYDGSCSVCAMEIEHYLRKDHGGKLVAVDINASDFNPELLHITLDAFMYELHAIDQAGQIYRGIEAFWAIWQAFPASTGYGIMGTLINTPVVNHVARLFYKGFARIRPYLPKRHTCDSGTCKIDRKG